jgi:hypothetical protein
MQFRYTKELHKSRHIKIGERKEVLGRAFHEEVPRIRCNQTNIPSRNVLVKHCNSKQLQPNPWARVHDALAQSA